MEEKPDILIRGGTAVTLSEKDMIAENAEIGIRNGRILFVRKQGVAPPVEAEETIDADGCYILPGLVNTHSHLPMVCFRGLADDVPLEEWLNHHIFPVEARFLSPAFCAAGARLAMAELIMSGTTTVCDAYFFPGSTARSAMDAGMRAVVCAGFADIAVPGIPDPSDNVRLAREFVDRWKDVSGLLTPALFCHAPYTCSPQTLQDIKDVARRNDVLFMTHLAETQWEVSEIRTRYGTTPLRHLDRLGILNESTVLVHCNWVDDEELDILGLRGAGVSHNPESSMKLAAGIAPVPAMLSRKITVGLGTDGAASNNDLDLFGEMKMTFGIHRLLPRNAAAMDCETVLKMATIEGARLLGLADEIGSIETGKRADIILIDGRKPHLTPPGNIIAQIVGSASRADVSWAIIDGRVVMRNGVICTVDIAESMADVRNIAGEIKKARREA